MRRFFAFAFVASAVLLTAAAPDAVRIDGGQISGTVEDGVRAFKGIPFAAPPVGALRWKAPQPTSEDCLYLNVWTTATAGAAHSAPAMPVMVWIHGGAWTRGSGSSPTYDGAALAKRGVVVVTTNYRLGVFGFLAHPELTAESPQHASGNYAILDHVAALEWVHKNIAAFGGDPKRVTIFGESAGSWSVNVVQATPLARGLFERAIGESGGQFARVATLAEAEKDGAAFASTIGASSLAALRAVPAERLAAAPRFRTGVNVDGYVLPDTVRALFSHDRENRVPVIVGSNANEWTTLSNPAQFPKTLESYRQYVDREFGDLSRDADTVYPVKSDADIPPAMLGIGRDRVFTLEMRTWARMVSASGQRAYLYQFTHVPPGPRAADWGAYHASEISYVFGNLRNPAFKYTDADRRLSDEMSRYWVNFATSGDPNGAGLPKWTAYDPTAEPYLDLGDTVVIKNHLLKPQLDFLERVQQQPRRQTSQPR